MKELVVILLLFCNLSVLHGQEICNDGIDNDNNGLFDCADPTCTAASCDDLFTCAAEAEFYQILDGIHFALYNQTSLTFDTLYTNANFAVDAIGYNTHDGYIYGVKPNTNELVRIDKNGFINLGTVPGLPWPGGNSYVFGDFDLDGNLFVGFPSDQNIYKINLIALSATEIAYTGSFDVSDIAYNATDDLFYGVNSNDELIGFDPILGTLTTPLSIAGINCGSTYGSSYIDSTGLMYFFCNDTGDLFALDMATASASLLQPTGMVLANNDGASCSLSDQLIINPPVLACDDGININIGQNCQIEVTYDLLLEGVYYPVSCLEVVLFDNNYNELASSPFIDESQLGQTLIFEVRDICDGNSCSGTLVGEDKTAPIINCPSALTVSCAEINMPIPLPPFSDNCTGVTLNEFSNIYQASSCDPNFAGIRTISYLATDASNNISSVCTTEIFYSKPAFGTIVFPVNYDDTTLPDLPSLVCSENNATPSWDLNGNGYPEPSETGYLTDPNGNPIFPNDLSCDLRASYTDNRIDVCESSFRVLRYWELLDWCNGDIENRVQIINVNDIEGPGISCPADITLSADDYNCIGNLIVPAPIINYDCGSVMDYTVSWQSGGVQIPCPINPNGFYTNSNVVGNSQVGFTITGLPLGCSWVKYTVFDDCGNDSECVLKVEVIDDSPPTPVCKENTVVTLGNDGWAHVFAQSFDNGSHDNCSNVSFGVRRIAGGCFDPSIPQPSVVFTDVNGVDYYQYVQFCCVDRTATDLEVELVIWDSQQNANTCTVNINVQDVDGPQITCAPTKIMDCTDQIIFDIPLVMDNCGIASIDSVDVENVSSTCYTGTYTRTWTATDESGLTASCSQQIIIENNTPFNGPINWPADILDLEGCINVDIDPSILGVPTYAGDLCSDLAYSSFDQVFNFVDGACFKILRNWTVIDWCVFDSGSPTGPGIWNHIQVIKVNDNTDPVLVCNTASLDITEGCEISAGVSISAMDDCGSLDVSYEIDYFADGSYEPSIVSMIAEGVWLPGTHAVRWTVSDHCGNVSSCIQTVIATDTKLPSPYCIGQVVSVIMPSSGTITLDADDYDLGSTDNCDNDLSFSFSSDVNHTSMVFDCSHQGINTIQIWVTDDAGNQDFCSIELDLQDNAGICPNVTRIGGTIMTETFNGVKNVAMNLVDENLNIVYSNYTDEMGRYTFDQLTAGGNYKLTPFKDDNYMNGVSTLDLLLIQKHILKLRILDSPYKYIAADINGDGKVSAVDLIGLRKLILGIIAALPNNDSWRFVDEQFVFADPTDPWPFVEELYYPSYNGSSSHENFIGVKIGDVNEDVVAHIDGPMVSSREEKEFSLDMLKGKDDHGNTEYAIYAGEHAMIQGMQFSLCIDGTVAPELKEALLTSENLDYFIDDNNVMNVIWTATEPLVLNTNDLLFSISFDGKSYNDINPSITPCQIGLNPQAYDQNLTVAQLVWNIKESENLSFDLFQNVPNPFSNQTQIGFYLDHAQEVKLEVFNLEGKMLSSNEISAEKGINTFDFKAPVNAKGVYYYRLQTAEGQLTKKMLQL